ncbi:MAG TPA: ATP-binding cassette domain-containing protein [Fimbriimonas sp.]|nr:ATP-binding cassette domain-containing protein [Fimbriimonas sp.]
MSEVLSLEHFSLSQTGPTLTMSVGTGQWLAIAGPASSGKSYLLRVLAGHEKADQGSFRARGTIEYAEPDALSRRSKVQTLTRDSEAFVATGLSERRHMAVSELTSSELAAAELLAVLSSDSNLLLIDGQLDRLDPWTLESVLQRLRSRSEATVIVATNRPDLLARFEALIVLRDRQVRFAGSPDELLRRVSDHHLTISTENQSGVQAVASPFEVSVEHGNGEVRLQAPEGQELAARLLLEGYGDVKLIVSRPPTIEEALLTL